MSGSTTQPETRETRRVRRETNAHTLARGGPTRGDTRTVLYIQSARRRDGRKTRARRRDFFSLLKKKPLRRTSRSRARREEPREDFFRPSRHLHLDGRAKIHQRLLRVVSQLPPLRGASVHLLAAFRRFVRGGNAGGFRERRRGLPLLLCADQKLFIFLVPYVPLALSPRAVEPISPHTRLRQLSGPLVNSGSLGTRERG